MKKSSLKAQTVNSTFCLAIKVSQGYQEQQLLVLTVWIRTLFV